MLPPELLIIKGRGLDLAFFQATLMQLVSQAIALREACPRRGSRPGLPVPVRGPVWETSGPCRHAKFWVASVGPICLFLAQKQALMVGSAGCPSTRDPGQTETPESLLSGCYYLLSRSRCFALYFPVAFVLTVSAISG